MEKVAATTGWAGKATARAEKWNGDVGKRKQKSHQEGTPHLEDRPDYNVKSFAPSPPRSPNPPPKAGCNDGPHPARIYYYISQTGSCGPASFFTGKRGPASGPPRSRNPVLRHRTPLTAPGARRAVVAGSSSLGAGCCIARSGKLDKARSRLYRGQILQENMRWKALAEIYTMHSFAQLCNLNFL